MTYDLYFFSGHGDGDSGAIGYNTTEETVVKRMTATIVKHLRDKGLNVHTNDDKNNYKDNLTKGNTYNYKFGYTLHLNSAAIKSANGIEIIVPAGEKDLDLDFEIIKELSKYFINRGVKSRNYEDELFYSRLNGKALNFTDYYKEIRESWQNKVSGGIIELCFISHTPDMQALLSNEPTVCTIIANCILSYLNKDIHPLSCLNSLLSSNVPYYIVQAGAFIEEKNAKALVDKLKALGIPAIVKRADLK